MSSIICFGRWFDAIGILINWNQLGKNVIHNMGPVTVIHGYRSSLDMRIIDQKYVILTFLIFIKSVLKVESSNRTLLSRYRGSSSFACIFKHSFLRCIATKVNNTPTFMKFGHLTQKKWKNASGVPICANSHIWISAPNILILHAPNDCCSYDTKEVFWVART